MPVALEFGAEWTADGNSLVYSLYSSDPDDDAADGIWIVDLRSKVRRKLMGQGDEALGYPYLLQVSSSGTALVVYEQIEPGETAPFALLDTASGMVTRLTVDGAQLALATLSPDGSKVLYTARDFDLGIGILAVQEVGGGPGHQLMADVSPRLRSEYRQGLVWARDNTVYIQPAQTLVRLEVNQ